MSLGVVPIGSGIRANTDRVNEPERGCDDGTGGEDEGTWGGGSNELESRAIGNFARNIQVTNSLDRPGIEEVEFEMHIPPPVDPGDRFHQPPASTGVGDI